MTTMIAEAPPTLFSDEDYTEAFTRGDCWRLALAMRDRYRLPVAFYIGYPGPEDPAYKCDSDTLWCHVFNVLPDGRFIDVTGIYSAEEMEAQWCAELAAPKTFTVKIARPTKAELDRLLYGIYSYYEDVDTDTVVNRLGVLMTQS